MPSLPDTGRFFWDHTRTEAQLFSFSPKAGFLRSSTNLPRTSSLFGLAICLCDPLLGHGCQFSPPIFCFKETPPSPLKDLPWGSTWPVRGGGLLSERRIRKLRNSFWERNQRATKKPFPPRRLLIFGKSALSGVFFLLIWALISSFWQIFVSKNSGAYPLAFICNAFFLSFYKFLFNSFHNFDGKKPLKFIFSTRENVNIFFGTTDAKVYPLFEGLRQYFGQCINFLLLKFYPSYWYQNWVFVFLAPHKNNNFFIKIRGGILFFICL